MEGQGGALPWGALTGRWTPTSCAQLRATYDAIVPGYHPSKRHWITIEVDGVPGDLVSNLVGGSHGLVVWG
jgi:predicted DNA-binding protein (MmcQ/YjbR family)